MSYHELDRHLCLWFNKHKIAYPFRQNRNPYRVWITEVILQQTRINYALDKITHFLECFPDVASLAQADRKDVLKAFEGLGYYNRATNLIAGSKYIYIDKYNHFPNNYTELLKVPSIGPYTAGIIASICFDEQVPAIDGNVKRVIARLINLQITIKQKEFNHAISSFLKHIFLNTNEQAATLNEALMELGQNICKKGKPLCLSCPISYACKAYQYGNQSTLPITSPRKPYKLTIWLMLCIQYQNKFLIQNIPHSYFLKRQWLWPSYIFFPDDDSYIPQIADEISYTTLVSDSKKIFFQNKEYLYEKNYIKHSITQHKIQIYVRKINPPCMLACSSHIIKWVNIEKAQEYFISNAMKKTLHLLI